MIIKGRKMQITIAALLCMFLLIIFSADSCDNVESSTSNVTSTTSETSTGLTEADCAKLQFKLACLSIVRRYNYLADPNKYGYFYEFMPGSSVPSFEVVVQGSVFPTSDLVNPENWQQPCTGGGAGACAVVLEKQQPDGTFGTNGTGVFGWDASGNYFEWNGLYHYDQAPVDFHTSNQIIVIGCKAGIPGC